MEIKKALKQQQNEIDEWAIYKSLADIEKNKKNKKILLSISEDEKKHYKFWEKITKKRLSPRKYRVKFYLLMAKILGLSFTLKYMEKNEESAEEFYKSLMSEFPESEEIYKDEKFHEVQLLKLIEDKSLLYAGAIVLGMNDALVELTGTLTGVALAFDNARYVGITGIIMGVSASLSMSGSAYLEAKENDKDIIDPKRYALYTGIAYILTTIIIVLPFFIFSKAKNALIVMFLGAIFSIFAYNYYISIARDEDFYKRVKEMFLITFTVSIISFFIGYLVNRYLGINI